MALIKFKRGTRAQLDAAAAANELNQGEPYYVTDEDVVAVGAAVDSAVDLAKASDLTTHTGSTTAHGISTFGASLVDNTDAATARSTLGLGTAATTDATAYATVAHNHTGVYEPADATILKSAAIGVSVQAYDADTAKTDTAQTWTAKQTFGQTAETWTTLTGTTPSITAGSHTWTLTGASTPTDGLSDGDHCTLMIDDGSASTINWASVVDQWLGGEAPELPTTGYAVVVLWKQGTTVYAVHAGDAS